MIATVRKSQSRILQRANRLSGGTTARESEFESDGRSLAAGLDHPTAVALRKVDQLANSARQVANTARFQARADGSPGVRFLTRLQESINRDVMQQNSSGIGAAQLEAKAPSNVVIQLMYKGAKIDIELLLESLRGEDDENETYAKAIAKESSLDSVTPKQMKDVAIAVEREIFNRENKLPTSTEYQASLNLALTKGSSAFAAALLKIIEELSQSEIEAKSEIDTKGDKFPLFESEVRKAVESHFPTILQAITKAQKASASTGKPLLVIIGEQHDDPYSRFIEAVLISLMLDLNLPKFYIETTPQAVEEHVAPYKEKEPEAPDTTESGHRQRFFRHVYEKGGTIEGVDVDKETAKAQVESKLGPRPEKQEELEGWKARFTTQSVDRRNLGISKTLRQTPAPGILLVGATHLAGLAQDPELASVYEIVTIATVHPKAAAARDIMLYGHVLPATEQLPNISGLVVAANEEAPNFVPEDVPASKLFALASEVSLEVSAQLSLVS
jgi:hypothetical protein